MFQNRVFWLAFCGLLLLSSCTANRPDPSHFRKMVGDEQVADFPPSPAEFTFSQGLSLSLFTSTDPNLQQDQINFIQPNITGVLESQARLISIDANKLAVILQREKWTDFDRNNLHQSLNLAQDLGAKYLTQIKLTPEPLDPKEETRNFFQGTAAIEIRHAQSGNLILKTSLELNANQLEPNPMPLSAQLQESFPLKGFVLETVGDRTLAKISLGAGHGVELGRSVTLHKRRVEQQGNALKEVIIPLPVAQGEVIHLLENEAWILIDEKSRTKVSTGLRAIVRPQSRFSLP